MLDKHDERGRVVFAAHIELCTLSNEPKKFVRAEHCQTLITSLCLSKCEYDDSNRHPFAIRPS